MAGENDPCAKLHDALASIVRDEQAGMISKWVALVEVIDADGAPAMWSMKSDGLSMWDQLGLLECQSRTLQPGTD